MSCCRASAILLAMKRSYLLGFVTLSVVAIILSIICFVLLQQISVQRLPAQIPNAADHLSEPITIAKASPVSDRAEFLLLQKLPTDEAIVALEMFHDGHLLAVTSHPQDADGLFAWAVDKIWLLSLDAEPKIMETVDVSSDEKINIHWDHSDNDLVQIAMLGGDDGDFYSETLANYYIDTQNEAVVATSTWTSIFSPTFTLSLGNQSYPVTLSAAGGCLKGSNDKAIGVQIGNQELKFAKTHFIDCPIFGEGAPESTLPELGAPSFHDNEAVFSTPWGTEIYLNLETRVVHSDDFSHDYVLMTSSTAI